MNTNNLMTPSLPIDLVNFLVHHTTPQLLPTTTLDSVCWRCTSSRQRDLLLHHSSFSSQTLTTSCLARDSFVEKPIPYICSIYVAIWEMATNPGKPESLLQSIPLEEILGDRGIDPYDGSADDRLNSKEPRTWFFVCSLSIVG